MTNTERRGRNFLFCSVPAKQFHWLRICTTVERRRTCCCVVITALDVAEAALRIRNEFRIESSRLKSDMADAKACFPDSSVLSTAARSRSIKVNYSTSRGSSRRASIKSTVSINLRDKYDAAENEPGQLEIAPSFGRQTPPKRGGRRIFGSWAL